MLSTHDIKKVMTPGLAASALAAAEGLQARMAGIKDPLLREGLERNVRTAQVIAGLLSRSSAVRQRQGRESSLAQQYRRFIY